MTRFSIPWVMIVLAACGSPSSPESPEPEVAPPARLAPPEDGSLDEASLFHLEAALEDQAERPFSLRTLAGHPILLTFFYSSCDTMCPLILTDVRGIEAALSESARAELRVVVISFDGSRDTAARLSHVAEERSLPMDRWTLVRGPDTEVRTVAATLGMSYRRVGEGEFAHAALFTLLDQEGRVVLQSEGVGRDPAPFVLAVESLVSADPAL